LNFGLTVKPLHCLIHPTIAPNILDHFLRKPEDQGDIVVGTLLGTIDGSQIDIFSSFAVPQYYEDKNLVIDTEYMQKMLKFHRKVNPNEGLLGMYISCKKLDDHGLALVQYFQELFQADKKKALISSPLIMMVDPTLSENKLSIKVYLSDLTYLPVDLKSRIKLLEKEPHLL
jgi:JAB1/Mov34/MPN/PAD-1 ubiquitin protease